MARWCREIIRVIIVILRRLWLYSVVPDSINIKILNAGAWARSSDRVTVTLPMELEDYIPQVEEFYRMKHNGRKLQWHHLMSNGIVSFFVQTSSHILEIVKVELCTAFLIWRNIFLVIFTKEGQKTKQYKVISVECRQLLNKFEQVRGGQGFWGRRPGLSLGEVPSGMGAGAGRSQVNSFNMSEGGGSSCDLWLTDSMTDSGHKGTPSWCK